MAYLPLETVLVRVSKWNYLDDDTPKCQLCLSNKIVADKASQLSSFFSTSKQEERITRDHVRPSATSFNHQEAKWTSNEIHHQFDLVLH